MKNILLEMANLVRLSVMAVPLEARSRTHAMGADGTPTSHIDKVAEDVIIKFMEERALTLNLLSEEAGFIDRGFSDTLVADPVDGTFNACAGIPFYSVSLAIGRNSLADVSEGMVMNLVTGDTFQASKGNGALLNGAPIHAKEPCKDRVLMAYLGASAMPHTYEVASRFKRVRCLGAMSLDICAVAAGQADAFFIEYSSEKKSPRVVDIAAAVLILREAGGQAYDGNREILNMPFSLEARKNMIAVSSKSVLELMS